MIAFEAAAAIAGLLSSASLCHQCTHIGQSPRFVRMVIKICKNGHQDQNLQEWSPRFARMFARMVIKTYWCTKFVKLNGHQDLQARSPRFAQTIIIKICKNGYHQITCNAPMPAFPNVHIDGAAAKALANAFLHQEDKNRETRNQEWHILMI